MKRISTLHASNGNKYEIVQVQTRRGVRYGAIEQRLIDANGKLTTRLNGLQMLLSETVADVIQRIEWAITVNKLVECGVQREVAAIAVVTGIKIEEAQKRWNETVKKFAER